ncbi:phosphatidylinositol-binding protein scs2, partial [Coemansia sp. RSA 1933]
NNAPVAFKIKTTAPKLYCVRPNAGRIEPGDGIDVQVVLQPMAEDPPAGKGCRDKFLIQSIQVSPEMESMPMTELWAMVEREAKSSISEKKLRVRHLPPLETADSEEKATPAAAASVSPDANTPKKRTSPSARTLPGPSPLAKSVESQGEESVNEATSAKSASPPPPQLQMKNAATPASSGRLFPDSSAAQSPEDTTSFADAKTVNSKLTAAATGDLDKAKAAIRDLEKQLHDCRAQLQKARNGSLTSSSSSQKSAAAARSSTDGLSIQSVAIIALVAFLFGYFFF